jgi:hypothetical protein
MKKALLHAIIIWIIFLFFYSFLLSTLESFGGNYSGFLRLRERRVDRIPFLTDEIRQTLILRSEGGYDGQWYYYISFDPFLREYPAEVYNDVIDAPPYRYTRIGFPLLTNVFSGGDPFRFPKTMILLILFFNLAGAIFFLKIIQHFGRSPFWAFLYLLIPCTTACLNLGVPESVSMSLLLGGLYFYLKERLPVAILFFACSILVRETSMLFVVILAALELMEKKRFKVAIVIGAGSILPLVLWKLFLTSRLFDVYGWETMHYSPGDFTYLFGGVYDLYFNNWDKTSRIQGLIVFPVLVIANLVFALILLIKKRDLFSLSLMTYCLLHLSLNYTKIWGHIRDLERTMSDGFLYLMLAFLALPAGSRPILRYSMLTAFVALLIYKARFSPIASHFLAGFDLPNAFHR